MELFNPYKLSDLDIYIDQLSLGKQLIESKGQDKALQYAEAKYSLSDTYEQGNYYQVVKFHVLSLFKIDKPDIFDISDMD